MKSDPTCGKIIAILPNSVAGRAGLHPGDCLTAVNGTPVRDVIDVQFYSADEDLELRFLRDGRERVARVSRDYDEPLGWEFEVPLFDGIRLCNNHCDFCFVRQMPRGLRRSLYVRDDDFRLSFLTGSFVTLSNLTEADWERIAEQRLSPLYVSVHATESALHARMLGERKSPDICAQLARLREIGIEVHTQVVLVPGHNDGDALQQTVADLASFYPTVASVSLVPVGLTRFQRHDLRRYGAAEAQALLQWAEPLRRQFYQNWGIRFVHPSDEWYLLAGAGIPGSAAYDGFPQIENGVGLARQFLDDWFRAKRRLLQRRCAMPRRMTWATGELFAPVLLPIAGWLHEELDITIDIVPVPNRFFGETVTVAGLLTAQDVVAALQGRELGDCVVLPRSMLDHAGQITLDEKSPEWLADAVGGSLRFADRLTDLLHC